MTGFEQVDPRALRPHPKNAAIYGAGTEGLDLLIEEIRGSGWIKPLVVTQNNVIISGHRRWAAALALGDDWATLPVERQSFTDEWAELEALLRENQYREKSPEQRVREAQQWESVEAERGRQNRTANLPGQSAESGTLGKSRDRLAQRVGFGGHSTYDAARHVVNRSDDWRGEGDADKASLILSVLNAESVDAAFRIVKQTPAVCDLALALLGNGEAKDGNAALRKALQQSRLDGLAAGALPEGPFQIVYADPPWRYEHVATANRAIENQYPTMDLDGICDLPIADLADEAALLFLWATSPKLDEALRVMDAWGFEYRTNLVWVKDKIGMGYYARQQHELLLIGRRGEFPAPVETERPPSVITGVRAEHSEKPAAVYDLIERMYPGTSRIELFARNGRPGWAAWGNQAPELVE